jgi:hypothetical protein
LRNFRALFIAAPLALAALSAASAAETRVVQRPAPGCLSKAAMARAHDLREQHDPAAAQALVGDGLATGDWFAAGEPVVVEDGDILADISKVHTVGDPQAFWISQRALDD